jgi:hypothetical protein
MPTKECTGEQEIMNLLIVDPVAYEKADAQPRLNHQACAPAYHIFHMFVSSG